MTIRTIAVAAAVALAYSANANAALLVETYTGTIENGLDIVGIFGAANTNLTGDNYTATYTINTADSLYFDKLPLYDGFESGSVYGYGSGITATLTIEGVTRSIAGSDYAFAFADPPTGLGPATSAQVTDSNDVVDGVSYQALVANQQTVVGPPSIFDSLPLSSTPIAGNAFFFQADGAQVMYAHFDSTPGTVQFSTESGVPEPAVWSLLLIGFGIVGGGLRQSRSWRELSAVR